MNEFTREVLREQSVDVNSTTADNVCALQLAMENDMPEIVMQLLNKRVQIRIKFGKTPLTWALLNKYEEITKKLVERGADVSEIDEEGNSPLHAAVKNQLPLSCQLLIKKGAEIQPKDKLGNTPLHFAARKGNQEILSLLLANGADPNVQGERGDTPLHNAILKSHTTVVQILAAQKDINVNIANEQGETPLDWHRI